MTEQTYFIVRLNGRLGTSYAALSLSKALALANPVSTDYIAWGVVSAKSVSVARMLDPKRWFAGFN